MSDPSPEPSPKRLTRADFDNLDVLNAINPHPTFGYFHGPIPGLQQSTTGWYCADSTYGSPGKWSTTTTSFDETPESPSTYLSENIPVFLNTKSSLVCDVVVGENGEMCGMVFRQPKPFRYHLKRKHSGAVIPPSAGKPSAFQNRMAESALKKLVLFGYWRKASYLNEPGRGSAKIKEYCDALENIANHDRDFAARFGERFHREGVGNLEIEIDVTSIFTQPWIEFSQRIPSEAESPEHPSYSEGIRPVTQSESDEKYVVALATNTSPSPRRNAKTCPSTPMKSVSPKKASTPRSSSNIPLCRVTPRKSPTRVKLKEALGAQTELLAPFGLLCLSDEAERYLASVMAGGPLDSWNMLSG